LPRPRACIRRREFRDEAARHAVGGLTARALLDLLKPDYAVARQVSFIAPDILASCIICPSPDGHARLRAYLVRPARGGVPIGSALGVHRGPREPWPGPTVSGMPPVAWRKRAMSPSPLTDRTRSGAIRA